MPTTLEALRACGLDEDAARRVADALDRPKRGAGDLPQCDDGCGLWLRAATAAARDPALLPRALPPLLAALEREVAGLPPFARAVHAHMRGLAAWRCDRDVPAATRAFNESLALLAGSDGLPARAYEGRVLDTCGQLLQHLGLDAEARLEYEHALEAKRACGDDAGAALTEGNLGRLCMALGDWRAAAEHLEHDLAFVAAAEPTALRLRGQLLAQLGACRTSLGQVEEAARRLEESLALAQAGGDAVGRAFALAYLARNALRAGQATAAGDFAEQARPALAALPDWARHDVGALCAQAEAEATRRRGDLAAALEGYERAARDWDLAPRASPIEHAEFLEAYATVCEEAGRRPQAADLVRRALRRLDPTTAHAMRERLEARLRRLDEALWLLHASGRFVGHAQVERLLGEAGRSGFRGRAEEVTILFSDLRGFTTLTEGLDPEVLVDLLNRYLGHMTRCVEHYGGFVDKFVGDAVMAVFSLPAPLADDAERAARAALYMQDEVERFNRTLPAGVPPFAAGVGLHRGRVVAGLVGSPQKRSYTVIGDAVNTASRLEGVTKVLGVPIALTREVLDAMGGPARWLVLPFGRLRPKGRRGAVEVWGLLGRKDGSPAARAASARAQAADDALARLQRGDFQGARAGFEALGSAPGPGRIGYEWLAARAAEFEAAPPLGWDGTLVLTEK